MYINQQPRSAQNSPTFLDAGAVESNNSSCLTHILMFEYCNDRFTTVGSRDIETPFKIY